MNNIKAMIFFGTIALLISCGPKKTVTFEEDLGVETPMDRIPGVIENMNYPEFDYSTIIERFKRGERIGAADLIDDYADNLDAFRIDLTGDRKAGVQIIVEDMQLLARKVRAKKISDPDELLSECIIIDREIGEIFIEEEPGLLSDRSDPSLLMEELKYSIADVRSNLSNLNKVQKIKANEMIIKSQALLSREAQKLTSWTVDVNIQLDILHEWLAINLPEEFE